MITPFFHYIINKINYITLNDSDDLIKKDKVKINNITIGISAPPIRSNE